jgi:uncharacterized protein VirK/YbjX
MLLAVARAHPGMGLQALRNRAVLLLQLARARPWLSRWMEQGPHALLRQHIERHPRLLGFVVWPYIHSAWPMEGRLAALSEHLRLVDQLFPGLALGEGEHRQLLSLDDLTPGLRLELDRARWFEREGGLVFNLCLHDHRLMSVPFSLARADGALIAYVGGIQGSHRPDAMGVYRRLTKRLHGLRPRDFALKMFQLFAGSLGVARILCVADECRHHRHAYFGGAVDSSLFLDYDQVWREHGGRPLSSGFFQLGVTPAAKPMEQVPSRKRAMYRRRHRMMDELARAMDSGMPPGSVVAVRQPGVRPLEQVRIAG